MPYATDGLVGKLALQKGWITALQLKEALAEQAAAGKAGPHKPLGVILVARGLLSDEKLLDLLEEQRRTLAEQVVGGQGRKDDALFGQILLKRGLATPEQINAALRTQAQAAERGDVPVPRLGQILMTMAPAHAPAIRKTLELQNKAVYSCPQCDLRYNLRQAEPGKQYRCRKCGTLLRASAQTDLRVDGSAYGMNLEVQTDLPPEAAQADLDPANRFDKFILLETLGRGGAGTVYRAFQKDLRRTVALKLLRAPDDETRQRFASEAQTAARLKHPNIVAVYETGSVDQVPWLAMEYVDGKPLDQGPKLPWRKAALLLRDVALAVDYAHGQGVLHRDLKPANILVDKEGRPFVTDFGLARELKGGLALTMTGMVVGTPAYMSPEQARGDRELDGRSDVCALGAVLYEMITGRTPFSGAEPVDIAMAVIHKDPLAPRRIDPAVPPDLEAICLKAMMKEKEARYATARELAVDLQRFAEGEPVTARRMGPLAHAFLKLRRQKARAAAWAGAAALLVVFLAVMTAVLRDSRAAREFQEAAALERAGELERALALYVSLGAEAEVARARHELEARRAEDARDAAAREIDRLLREAARPDLPAAQRATLATRAAQLQPDLETAYVLRALAHLESGADDVAYADFGRAAERSRAPLPHWMSRAEIAGRLGRPDEEIVDLTRALECNPGSADLRLRRADAGLRIAREIVEHGRTEAAGEAAARLLEAETDLAAAGRSAMAEGVRAALERFDRALPQIRGPMSRALAAAFAERGFAACPAQAVVARAAARAVAADLTYPPSLAVRGLAALLAGRDADAFADADRALDLLPGLPEGLAVRGLVRRQRGGAVDYADGTADTALFLERVEGRPTLSALRDHVLQSRTDPHPSERARAAVLLAERAATARVRGDAGVALRLLDRAVELDGRRAVPFRDRGDLRAAANRWAEAAQDWARAVELDASLRDTLDPRIAEALRGKVENRR